MIELQIPEYITHVQLSKARKAKYWRKKDESKLPIKYRDKKKYRFNKEGYLVELTSKLRVIANPKSAGTPRYLKINGQSIYSGNMRPMVRAKVVNAIKDFFRTYTDTVPNQLVPIRLECDIYAPLAAKNWDLDNQWLYHKCFIDALVASEVIFDDNVMFVTQSPGFRYFPVDTPEERKLVYRIIQEDRPEILEHETYKSFHSSPDSDESLTF
jgi:hypothetical protein